LARTFREQEQALGLEPGLRSLTLEEEQELELEKGLVPT
jgi:hypothetical protein